MINEIIPNDEDYEKIIDPLNYIPTDQTVLVSVDNFKQETMRNGIIIPGLNDKTLHDRESGKIIKMGDTAFHYLLDKTKNIPKVGDRIYFKRNSGIDMTPTGRISDSKIKYRIIADQDIVMHANSEIFLKGNNQ